MVTASGDRAASRDVAISNPGPGRPLDPSVVRPAKIATIEATAGHADRTDRGEREARRANVDPGDSRLRRRLWVAAVDNAFAARALRSMDRSLRPFFLPNR